MLSLFLHHFCLQIHTWNESRQSISSAACYTFSHIRSRLRRSEVLKLFKCGATPEQRNPLCSIGGGWLSLLGRQTQAGRTFKADGGGNTPAHMPLVVTELKLMLRVVKHSGFSACHSVKTLSSKSLLDVSFAAKPVLRASQNCRAASSCSIIF